MIFPLLIFASKEENVLHDKTLVIIHSLYN